MNSAAQPIFGDIQDEHDKTRLTAAEIAPGVFEFSGRIEVRALRDDFRIDIPEDDEYQTLAGYLIHATGTLPAQGETLEIDGLKFTIQTRSATRLDLIRIEKPQPEAAKET